MVQDQEVVPVFLLSVGYLNAIPDIVFLPVALSCPHFGLQDQSESDIDHNYGLNEIHRLVAQVERA